MNLSSTDFPARSFGIAVHVPEMRNYVKNWNDLRQTQNDTGFVALHLTIVNDDISFYIAGMLQLPSSNWNLWSKKSSIENDTFKYFVLPIKPWSPEINIKFAWWTTKNKRFALNFNFLISRIIFQRSDGGRVFLLYLNRFENV